MHQLSPSPHDAVKLLLSSLPAKRMRDVLERRFWLKGRGRATLEEIGGTYRITRERVRQIEADALRRLREQNPEAVGPLMRVMEEEIRLSGGVMAERHLFSRLSERRAHPHLAFVLHADPRVIFFPESELYRARWAMDRDAASAAEDALHRAADSLSRDMRTLRPDAMRALLRASFASGGLSDDACDAHLALSKMILQNPYREYGLASWSAVSPRGIKDKAYAALLQGGAPLHFRDVAAAIDRAGWGVKKKAHAQTVHNELIKDQRFVLVGRGTYALQEWGYEAGTVGDVLVSLLKRSSGPLDKEELVRLAGEKRMVKPQTILLNLQDRRRFRRTDDGKYALV